MYKIFTLTLAAFFVAFTSFMPIKGLDDVITALNTGNATELARYVDDNIEIGLPDKTDTYSKAQAVMIFKDFFANNAVRSFEIKHKGDSGGKQFCVGVLHTRSGDYRTQVFMSSKNGRQLVKVISFQPA